MKNTTKLVMICAMFLATTALFAQDSKETKELKVLGNCGMCESRIEKAATAVEGVTKADWDKETKMMKVVFDSKKTDVHKIEMAIAKVGHDTKMHKAKDEVYNKLPGCCKYDREVKETHDHGHKH